MSTGWDDSADAWIADMAVEGDWYRRHVLGPALDARLAWRRFGPALDAGCGEGWSTRLLRRHGIAATGIDPTAALLAAARRLDPGGDYRPGRAEALDFPDASFGLVLSALVLIDIADFRAAIREMARVLRPGGTLLIANLTGFTTAMAEQGWVRDAERRRLHYPVDRYSDEFPQWLAWRGVRIENWHRPLSAYMAALLGAGLDLRFFDEPLPAGGDPDKVAAYRRAPYFVVMEWRKPEA